MNPTDELIVKTYKIVSTCVPGGLEFKVVEVINKDEDFDYGEVKE